MSSRNALSTAVVVIALAVGNTLFAIDRCCGFKSAFDSVQLSALAPQSRQATKPPTIDDNLFSRIDSLLKLAGVNTDLILSVPKISHLGDLARVKIEIRRHDDIYA